MEDKSKYSDPVMEAFHEGHHAVLATGNINDYEMDVDNNTVIYTPYYVAEKLYSKGYLVLRYNRSGGLSVYREKDIPSAKKSELNDVLRKSGLADYLGETSISPTEVIDVFRGFKTIMTTQYKTPFLIIVDYTTHLCAQGGNNEEKIVAEAFNDMACLPKAKRSHNFLLAFAHEECNLPLLLKNMHKVEYSYPNLTEYQSFIDYLSGKDDQYAKCDIPSSEMAMVCRGLQLRQIEDIFKAAKVNGQLVSKKHVISQKESLIERMSDGTLTVLDTSITFDDLAGMDVAKERLTKHAEDLAAGKKSSARAILLIGPPGNGKSTVVRAFANACGYNLVELSDSIKSKWVGESEARLQQALNLVVALSPTVLMIDEIDQTFPNRSSAGNDGGVSQHYLKTIFKFAARDDLRGKIVIVACSNTPQLLDPAMIDRFGVTIPLLEATPKDIVRIFPKIEKRITDKETLNPNSPVLLQGAEILYAKGASPRQIFDVITRSVQMHGEEYSEDDILESCKAYRGNGDRASAAFSSLSAIQLTGFTDYFPWIDAPSEYSYPWYLEDIVNKETGEVNEILLNEKINEFAKRSRF